jgi:hypothetical protein
MNLHSAAQHLLCAATPPKLYQSSIFYVWFRPFVASQPSLGMTTTLNTLTCSAMSCSERLVGSWRGYPDLLVGLQSSTSSSCNDDRCLYGVGYWPVAIPSST